VTRGGLARVVFLILVLQPAAPDRSRAEAFLSPGLEAVFGWDSNRFREPGEEESSFVRLTPSLEALFFLPADGEVFLSLGHARTEYARSDFGHVGQTSGQATVSVPRGALTTTVSLSAGAHRDDVLPEDDVDWLSASPGVTWGLPRGVLVSAAAAVTGLRYDSRETLAGNRETQTRWEVLPGLAWAPRDDWRLWIEAVGEINRSNESAEEYAGAGVTGGVDATLLGAGRAGGWVRLGVREYRDDLGSGGESRRDTPVGVGGWAVYRLAPWAELTTAAAWTDYRSTDAANDYTVWSVEGGVRFVYDANLSSP